MADLFGGLKKGFGTGVKTVGVRSKELSEISKIKNDMEKLKSEITAKLPELGEFIYTMYKSGEIDREKIVEKCRAIAELETAVKDEEKKMKLIRRQADEALGKRFCPGCEGEVKKAAKYCSQCGKNLS